MNFSNGKEVELPCKPEDFAPLLTARFEGNTPEVMSFTLIVDCLYCGEAFETKDPRAKYESQSHRKLASLYKLPSVKQRNPDLK